MSYLESFENIEHLNALEVTENFAAPLEEGSCEALDEAESSLSESRESLSEINSLFEKYSAAFENYECLSDMEMRKGIADYLESSDLRYENWCTMTLEERVELLNEMEENVAAIEHRPALKVFAENLGPGNFGYQQWNLQKIAINSSVLYSNDPAMFKQVVETLIHEGRHAYQHYNVDVKCIHESIGEVEEWAKNFNDPNHGYYSYRGQKVLIFDGKELKDVDFRLYEYQPVEIDARSFASDVVHDLEKRGVL